MRGLSDFSLLDCESLKGSLSFTYFCVPATSVITIIATTVTTVASATTVKTWPTNIQNKQKGASFQSVRPALDDPLFSRKLVLLSFHKVPYSLTLVGGIKGRGLT